MADFPALPLWTDAYLADTRHLTTEQHGAYLLLLMEAWRRKDCALPNDDRLLARLVGMSTQKWVRMSGTVMAFWELSDGYWFQNRLKKERAFCEQRSQKQRDRVNTRWLKTKKTDDTVVIPQAIPDGYRSDTPTPTPLLESESVLLSESIQGVSESEPNSDQLPLTVGGFDRFWDCWTIPGTKRGKGTAKAKYTTIVRRGKISPEQICQAVTAYMAWCLQSELPPSKIKHPATWLNAGAWDDDLVLDPPRAKHEREGVMEVGKRILQRAAAARDRRTDAVMDLDAEEPGPGVQPGGAPIAVLPDGREVPLHGSSANGGPVDCRKQVVPIGDEGLRGRTQAGQRPCDSADRKQERSLAGDQEQLDPDLGSAIGDLVSAKAWPS